MSKWNYFGIILQTTPKSPSLHLVKVSLWIVWLLISASLKAGHSAREGGEPCGPNGQPEPWGPGLAGPSPNHVGPPATEQPPATKGKPLLTSPSPADLPHKHLERRVLGGQVTSALNTECLFIFPLDRHKAWLTASVYFLLTPGMTGHFQAWSLRKGGVQVYK